MIKKLVLLDDYLTSLDPIEERTLRAVIEFILSEFPHLEVKISWNVPQIHRRGQYVFGVSALKNHLALAPWSSRVIEDFRQRLETDKYVVRKNLFQIPTDWEINSELGTLSWT
jgi:uncharacterized protein